MFWDYGEKGEFWAKKAPDLPPKAALALQHNQEVFMDEEKKLTRNERVVKLAKALEESGYKIKSLEFLVDDNPDDERTASQVGMPFLKLTLSV